MSEIKNIFKNFVETVVNNDFLMYTMVGVGNIGKNVNHH